MEMMIADFCTKSIQYKLFKMFRKMILNLNIKYVKNIMCAKELSVKEGHKTVGPPNNDQSPQDCVGENSDKTSHTPQTNKRTDILCREGIDTRNIIPKKRPELMKKMKSLAVGPSGKFRYEA